MKTQVIIIGGGDAFDTYEEYLKFLTDFEIDGDYLRKKRWKKTFQQEMGDGYEVLIPEMPNKFNAKYLEWKIWFGKLAEFFDDNIILVGHSMGGIFLAKYLSENVFPKHIQATFLLAAPFDETDADYKLADFDLPEDLSLFEKQGGGIHIYHSTDDPVVPFTDMAKYQAKLPFAIYKVFDNYAHFNKEKFPELIEAIKKIK